MSATKILLLTPYFKENRGNSTTAKRISAGLKQNGFDVTVFAYEEERWNDEIQTIADHCDLIHIIHFYRFSKWLKETNFELNKPFVMTNGGTDVNHDLDNDVNRGDMRSLLERTSAITVFTNDAKLKLRNAYSDMNLKLHVIPQSVWFPPSNEEKQDNQLPLIKGDPAILLPAGLRAVKDIFYLMEELISLQKKYPHLQFVIAGMVLDGEIYETLQHYMRKYNWLHFLENVPIEEMKSLYKWADFVLNTSISEGQSSALLEAMDMDCLVLARNNPGNASIIQDGINGFLFKTRVEFSQKIEAVMHDEEQRKSIIHHAKNHIQSQHCFEDEIKAFIKLYEECLKM
ncbi:MAG TPA: glycosyltransferase family 4 protein [Bacillus bacterium]|nr:glycosyltransferase family 4 protein [Bacillus sp. (in: firmicutes)]